MPKYTITIDDEQEVNIQAETHADFVRQVPQYLNVESFPSIPINKINQFLDQIEERNRELIKSVDREDPKESKYYFSAIGALQTISDMRFFSSHTETLNGL